MTRDVLPPSVDEALKSGNTIEAIKRLRGITGLGLKEAKDWIDSYQRGDKPPPPTAFDAPSEGNRNANFTLPPAALDALKAGNAIEAIKIVREATGVGLAEAKAIVDMIQGQMKSGGGSTLSSLAGAARNVAGSNAHKDLAPGQVASGGGAGKWFALAAVIAVVIAVAFLY